MVLPPVLGTKSLEVDCGWSAAFAATPFDDFLGLVPDFQNCWQEDQGCKRASGQEHVIARQCVRPDWASSA